MSEPKKRYLGPFWTKVRKGAPDECWPWLGYLHTSGHGLTSLNSIMCYASKKAWVLTNGPVRDGLSVLHTCDAAACCNPSHMYLGTRADNMHDRFGKRAPEDRMATGRPFMLSDAQIDALWEMRRQGATLTACAAKAGVHIKTVARYITAARKLRILQLRHDRLSAVAKVHT